MALANDLGIFPKLNVRDITLPSSHQKLADFRATLEYLLEIIPLRRLPEQRGKPVFMDYSTLKPFRQLCNDFCTEFADNNESRVSNNHINEYVKCHKDFKDCIKLFEQNRDIMDFDMSDIPFLGKGDEDYFIENKKNWYRLVYDYLVFCEGSFTRHLSKISSCHAEQNKKSTYSEYARALQLKGISIDTNGIGVNDGIDYAGKFGLKSGKTLYNKGNYLLHFGLKDQGNVDKAAQEIVEKFNL